jgi:hypothetical protein
VEKRGGLQPDKVSQALIITRNAAETGSASIPDAQVVRRVRLEGKHPEGSWPFEALRPGYAPSQSQVTQWPEEALIEGWLSSRADQCVRCLNACSSTPGSGGPATTSEFDREAAFQRGSNGRCQIIRPWRRRMFWTSSFIEGTF